MKEKNRYLFYTLIIMGLVLMLTNRCKKEEEKSVSVLITTAATHITTTTATSGGTVTSDGNATIFERGVCYGTNTCPTTVNSKLVAAGTTGGFTSNLTGLSAGETYYVRAYATNSVGTAYGNEISFTTTPLTVSTLITAAATDITTTTAISGGNVTSDGNAAISERGVCYGTNTCPTTVNSKLVATGTTGTFTSSLSGLTAGATYFVRAYAINSVGTAYGNEISFTTFALADIDNNYYNSVTIGSQTWMKENLKTTKYSDGSAIPNIIDKNDWITQTAGAYSWYNNDAATYFSSFGALYNWYTVVDSRNLCPTGWHVPTDAEWKTLEVYLGMTQEQVDDIYWRGTDQGVQMKSNSGWSNDGSGNNSSGFTALPGGFRGSNGYFLDVNICGTWWSATEFDASEAWYRFLNYSSNEYRNYVDKKTGLSVRCLRDN